MSQSTPLTVTNKRMFTLSLASLGVVFGDIGTSPLYALKECFSEHYHLPVTHDNILGLLSLIFYSILAIVYVKYIFFILKADNNGEGGGLALLARAFPSGKVPRGFKRALFFMGILGASLLFGDGMITPAISVLSAIEGLKIATPGLEPFIVPITVGILIGLFSIQAKGSHLLGMWFGPIILVYFLMLAVLGIPQIISNPHVIAALNPMYAIKFFTHNGLNGVWVLGSVFLAVTGCEALYADMGHFGRKPIQIAWSFVTFPALVLNYFGQGALLLNSPDAIENPFFRMAPGWTIFAVGGMATLATIIASQALISGVFSLTNQAISLGFSPRMEVIHTSSQEKGQIYVPLVNWILMASTIWLVISFKTTSALAGAYGIGVALTMLVTTILVLYVAHEIWGWSLYKVLLLGSLFLAIDGLFFFANLPKIPNGGWFPLVTALGIFTLMTTWKRGRRLLALRLREQSYPFEQFLADLSPEVKRIPGVAFFLTTDPEVTPNALTQNVKHNHVLHEKNILLSVVTRELPRIPREKRIHIESFPNGFYRVRSFFGFMESPSIAEVIASIKEHQVACSIENTTFFLGRETLLPTHKTEGLSYWRKYLFSIMSRNAQRATQFFKIPPNQVIEIGSQIEL